MNIFLNLNDSILHLMYKDKDGDFSHEIEFPRGTLAPSDDVLASIALFMRPRNADSYTIEDIVVTKEMHQWLVKQYKSINISCSSDMLTNHQEENVDWYLAFSGGFDSIAAHALIKDIWPHSLCSIDFGGNFKRESIFFSKFNTLIIKSNIRSQSVKFNEGLDWRFLLAPLLIIAPPLVNKRIGVLTGTIMEAAPYWFSGNKRTEVTKLNNTLGSHNPLYSPTGAITEYGTTLIAYKSLHPKAYLESLDSLAALNSVKRFRKLVLQACVTETTPPILNLDICKKHIFGKSFGEDMVALYVRWKLGKNYTDENYCTGIPDDFSIDMSFFEKINIENIKLIPKDYREPLLEKMKSFGLAVMTEEDLSNVNKCAQYRADFIKR